MLFVCYPKCTTCQKAKKWLDDRGIEYEIRDIKTDNPNEKELRAWHKKSGLPLRRFLNVNGKQYREQNLKERFQCMSEKEQFALLASDGMLVKRPIIIGDTFVSTGFKQPEWEHIFGK